jgi:hypothetical protein
VDSRRVAPCGTALVSITAIRTKRMADQAAGLGSVAGTADAPATEFGCVRSPRPGNWYVRGTLSGEFPMLFPLRCLLLAANLMAASCTAVGLQEGSAAARDPNVPGATGQAVVIGSSSSMAGSERVHPDWGKAGVGAQRGD